MKFARTTVALSLALGLCHCKKDDDDENSDGATDSNSAEVSLNFQALEIDDAALSLTTTIVVC